MSINRDVKPKVFANNVNIEQDFAKTEALNNASPTAAGPQSGVGGGRFPGDPCPLFEQTPSEYVLHNERNAWVVLGVDRNYNKTSGYGGRGHTQVAAIDLVAGRMASYVRKVADDGSPASANPDFKVDAARIYISQKADIDDYFELKESPMGKSKAMSAVAVKADDVRLIARNGIKLVTGTDTRNSLGLRQIEAGGIELIAGDMVEKLQPLVKGENMLNCIVGLKEQIKDLRKIVFSLLQYQMNFNAVLTGHTHLSNWPGAPTPPSVEVVAMGNATMTQHVGQSLPSLVSHATNMELWEIEYLNPAKKTYINSQWNKTN
ncbi:hypothetical protein CL634_03450 [bacterium]|nr:hypothetical protein [bacterium]|tara:strand:- start:90 stop:1046 length:957 start_codon:yes stop_codon:yes gene_type:complete